MSHQSGKSLSRFLLFLFFILLFLSGLLFWRFWQTEEFATPKVTALPNNNLSPLRNRQNKGALSNPALEKLDQEFTKLVSSVIPSVVSIITTDEPDREELLRELLGFSHQPHQNNSKMGSGMIVSATGDIITNWHVIDEASEITVELYDGRRYQAKLIGGDPLADIAVLHISAQVLHPIELGNSEEVQVGQTVVAIGNPFGLKETVTQGIISAKGRRAMSEARHDYFQTSASINPGNSGGPLVDIHGQVIGINNFIISKSGGAEGLAFAIPSNVARRIYDDITRYGRVLHPWFGILMRPIQPALAHQLGIKNNHGVLIAAILPSSPAHQAGLKVGDLIISLNHQPIKGWVDLRQKISETHPGETIPVQAERNGTVTTYSVTIKEEPQDLEEYLEQQLP